MRTNTPRALEVLSAYDLSDATLTPVVTGNINETYIVGQGDKRQVLQRLNPIFKPEIHFDIEFITEALAAAQVPTPRLIRTRSNSLWVEDTHGGIWRLLTYIDGVVHSEIGNASLCSAAGTLLGRFHRALGGLQHTFHAPRLGVHDTGRHVRGLEEALLNRTNHVAFAQIEPIGRAILHALAELPPMPALPSRIVHGDPKIQNIVFDDTATVARALIDLDTLAHMALPLELGDAFRSWCNPGGENRAQGVFDMGRFEAGLVGYATHTRDWLQDEEVAALPVAVETIALELAARFARDTLEESYFGWDNRRFAAAWEHHLQRARGQWTLARSYAEQRGSATDLIKRVFGR